MQFAGDIATPKDGSFVANITHFGRAIRKAGLPAGPGRIADAIRAVEAAGFTNRQDFFWALQACFVARPEQRQVFGQIFRLYWRNPKFLEDMMAILAPVARRVERDQAAQATDRLAGEALLDGAQPGNFEARAGDVTEVEFDATMTYSNLETLRQQDFEQMGAAEMMAAKRLIATIELPVRPLASRRSRVAVQGALPDWPGTIRRAVRNGGEIRDFGRRKRTVRWPNLVALCDISGSMSAYSRAVLHFLHAASNAKGAGWADVHSFTFGTRLTNISRQLRSRDVDTALAQVGSQAKDWEGGTRIGDCLQDFNRLWSRRVLGQGAVVLLITDGLDRDDPEKLGRAMQRLHLSARKVIWLNPLLRWDGFAPKARGIVEMLPHVDSFRAGHNIASFQALAEALTRADDVGEKARLMAMMRGD
ncbi:MAG: VWA domain-containing protein [Paracoccaceae bacterium]